MPVATCKEPVDLWVKTESQGIIRVKPVDFIHPVKIWPCRERTLHKNGGAIQSTWRENGPPWGSFKKYASDWSRPPDSSTTWAWQGGTSQEGVISRHTCTGVVFSEKMVFVGGVGEKLSTETMTAECRLLLKTIHPNLSLYDTSLLWVSVSSPEPEMSSCKQNFVPWPFKSLPGAQADSCLLVADRISSNFHSQMLYELFFLPVLLWAG